MNKMELYSEWQRLSKLAKEAHDDFDKAHHQYYTSDINNESERGNRLNERRQHLIEIRAKAGEIYDKYEAVK